MIPREERDSIIKDANVTLEEMRVLYVKICEDLEDYKQIAERSEKTLELVRNTRSLAIEALQSMCKQRDNLNVKLDAEMATSAELREELEVCQLKYSARYASEQAAIAECNRLLRENEALKKDAHTVAIALVGDEATARADKAGRKREVDITADLGENP